MSVNREFARGPIDRQDVERLELEWGIQFPDDYVSCVLENNAGSPEAGAITIEGRGRTQFQQLLDVNEPDRQRAETMRRSYATLRRFLPEGIYPFGSEPSGDAFCFDYRGAGESSPIVVLWDHERAGDEDRANALLPVAESFTEMIAMFGEIDDD